jgi:hypothetical protein
LTHFGFFVNGLTPGGGGQGLDHTYEMALVDATRTWFEASGYPWEEAAAMKIEANNVLAPPPAVEVGRDALEVARIWIVDSRVHTTIRTGIWEDPASWGILMVDIARQVATAYRLQGNHSEANVLRRLKQAIDAEWSTPTDCS